MASKDMKTQLQKDFETKIAEVNQTLAKGAYAEVEGKLAELQNIEKEFRSIREKEVFASCVDTHEALVRHHFETIAHKKTLEESRLTGVEATTKEVQIDLRKFCETRGFDMSWFYEMQALNKRLTLRIAMNLGVSTDEIRKINDSYSMDKLASEIELGKTVCSDTQIVRHMQKVLDELSPDEGRVNSHDLAYVLACYSRRNNKAALRVICSRHAVLQSLLTDVFHRVATGGFYGVDYKRASTSATEVQETKSKPKKAKAATTGEVSEPETVVVKKDEPVA